MTSEILPTATFYTQVAHYMQTVDPGWELAQWEEQCATEIQTLSQALGPAHHRSILDCTCGNGGQAIPLARLGWHVTASDITDSALASLKDRAAEHGLAIRVQHSDVRQLTQHFAAEFDWVLTCMALDNLPTAHDLQQALDEVFGVLKPGGQCYIRLRDLDNIMDIMPRYEVEEHLTPQGMILRVEDWAKVDDTHLIHTYIYLRQHKTEFTDWESAVFSHRRLALRKSALLAMLCQAGFINTRFLPQVNEWHPYALIAEKPTP